MKLILSFLAGAIALLALGMSAPRISSSVLGVTGATTTTATFMSPSYIARQPAPAGIVSTTSSGPQDAGSTGAPFTVYPDEYYVGICNGAACVGPGAFASCTYGDPNFQPPVAASTLFQLYVPPGVTSVVVASNSSSDAGCEFYQGIR